MRKRVFSLWMLMALLSAQWLAPTVSRAEGEDDPLWNRPSYEKKIIDIGQRILAANGIKERIAFIYNIKHERNAYAKRWKSPNTIVVYKDMTSVMSSDDELAAILAHEIAHIVDRHTRKEVLREMPIYVAGAVIVAATDGLAAPLMWGAAAANKKISRGYESQADSLGLDLMVKAGYNPLAMETILTKAGSADGGPFFRVFLNDHPIGTKRLADVHEAIKQKYPQFLTTEMANNPLPGSPYQLQPKAVATKQAAPGGAQSTGNQTQAVTLVHKENHEKEPAHPATNLLAQAVSKDTDSKAQANIAGNALAFSSSTISSTGAKSAADAAKTMPEPLPKAESGPAAGSKPVYTKPAKVNYQSPQWALKPAPKKIIPGVTEQSAEVASVVDPTQTSVAQVLLDLEPDQLRILKMISAHKYMSREELTEELAYQDQDALENMLRQLLEKKLIRMLGEDPSEAYKLTDWAAQAFGTPKALTGSPTP